MTKYRFLSVLLVLWVGLTVCAAPRSASVMKSAAGDVLSRHCGRAKAPHASRQLMEMAVTSDYAIYGYDDGGFAVIAVDDALPAVLGYSNKPYNGNTTNKNFLWWLDMVQAVSQQVRTGKANAPAVTLPDTTRFKPSVPTLLTSEWGQDTPFWNMCPVLNGDTCVTGCVATAMAQIIYYNRFPVHGIGQNSDYFHGSYLDVNFGEATYDFDSMRDLYYQEEYTQAEADAVALLMYHCGVAVSMEYDPEGSGAFSQEACQSMKSNFGYSDASYLMRYSYSEKEWMNIIYDELSNNYPVYYSGSDPDPYDGGGHAFVIDGYDEHGLVSVNWGWNGTENGYYSIALLNPRTYSFREHQSMITGLHGYPDSLYMREVTLTEPGTLKRFISATVADSIYSLKVTGKINNSDLGLIRRMAGRNNDGSVSRGHLAILDLGEATIVSGGEPYLSQDGKTYKCKDHELGDFAFYGCRQLRTLTLPPDITFIGKGCFGFCTKLDSISGLRDSEECNYILDGVSLYDRNDTTVLLAVLPQAKESYLVKDGVTLIGDYAFSSCQHIKNLEIPSSVKRIGVKGLYCSWKLQQIKIYSKEPVEVGIDGLTGIRKSSGKLLVPAGSKEKYKRHSEWGAYVNTGADGYDNIVEFGTCVTARNAGKVYGDDMPRLGYSISGDMPNGTPEIYCEADKYSPAGTYPIHILSGTITDEIVDYIDGVLTVWKANLDVTVGEYTRYVGDENPDFTYTISGFKLDENEDVIKVMPEVTCVADADSPEGDYPILVSGGEADNYEFRYHAGVLHVVHNPLGISQVNDDNQQNNDIYTLDGRKVQSRNPNMKKLPSGVYIIKGKKLIVK